MLAETLVRLQDGIEADLATPLIVCNQDHEPHIDASLAEAGLPGCLVLEPSARNTAAAAALACHAALVQNEAALLLLLPADHDIRNGAAFRRAINTALPLAQTGQIVCFGIEPSRPETGFGYIKGGDTLPGGFELARFVEKPNLKTAEGYVADGSYFWNAGIFLFSARTFLDELAAFRPDIAEPVERAFREGPATNDRICPAPGPWNEAASDSIDYAVGERTRRGAIVPVTMGWSDVGSYNVLHDLAPKDEDGNAVHREPQSDIVLERVSDSYIRAEGGRVVTVAGCEGLVVVDTPDALFVGRKDKSQLVKDVVCRLRDLGLEDVL